ncbi:MAG TPA: peptidoglycan editing factor PgeF [Tahibacter sp.]|uniref:peptidoglycan editing factor PgeF n=1 Tax=Tahibacter sp. TaxID=2056211 RepID=UPI002BDB398B|nr:peptidoglycan editing factor PgeF [Tahibacter sp.]HSX61832.1 peptidoglycan editing factor PgeF [Tahibacter sp.]
MNGDPATRGALIPDFPLPPGVRAAVTTRTMHGISPSPFDACNLGSRCGDTPINVAANRAGMRDRLALPSEPQWLRQVHGTGVHVLDAPGDPARDHHDDPVADAVYTNRPGLVCVVQTADCLPLLLASSDGREIAAVHAGWRGLAAGVIEAALRRFDTPPSQVRAWLGPAIAVTSYEVGDEVRAAFVAHDANAAEAFTATRPGHWLCDLYLLARQRLAAAGVVLVYGGGFDTFTDARFYSHRRSRPTGRFASLIWIEPAHRASYRAAEDGGALEAPARRSRLIFPRLLGRTLLRVPATVQVLHLRGGARRYRGRVTIERGRNWLARFCAFVTGMPPAMTDAPLAVDIVATSRRERWTRDFDGHRMTSTMWRRKGRLAERLGLVTFHFRLGAKDGALTWTVERVRALGIPLPVAWFDGVSAREFEQDGRYCFDVSAALPLAGELVHYRGWLDVDPVFVPEDEPQDDDDWDVDGEDSDWGDGDGGDSDGGD